MLEKRENFPSKSNHIGTDKILMKDSADNGSIKEVLASELISGNFTPYTQKNSPVSADIFLIGDSADSFNLKKVPLSEVKLGLGVISASDSTTWTGNNAYTQSVDFRGGINSSLGDLSISRMASEQIRLASSNISIYKAMKFELGANSLTMLCGGNGGISLQSTGGAPRAEFKVDGSVNSFLILRNSVGTATISLYSNGTKSEILSELDVNSINVLNMKSGNDQGSAGAVANELWFDLNDGNTVKMGV